MLITRRRHLRGFVSALVIGLSLLTTSMVWQVQPVQAGTSLNAQANELVRLINGDRAAAGKRVLAVDPFLASKATNGAIPCPDAPNQNINGRTLDFETWGNMSHLLRLCLSPTYALSTTPFVSVLQSAWGYGNVGEIDLVNAGYGIGQFLYTFTGSQTWSTWTYATTGHALMGWNSSSSHWNIVMGTYDRIGCGGWSSGASYYYDCVFAQGGPSPNGLTAPPTRSPFSDSLPTPPPAPTLPPTQAPPPPPPKPVPTPAVKPVVSADPTGGYVSSPGTGAGLSVAGVTASPEASNGGAGAGAVASPDHVAQAIHVPRSGSSSESADSAPLVPTQLTSDMAVVAGSAAALLSAAYALLTLTRRRRGRGDPVA